MKTRPWKEIRSKKVAYTVGDKKGYDESLAEVGREPKKIGREEGYEGGCIWQTLGEAEEWLKAHPQYPYDVYMVQLPNGWDTDVDTSKQAEEGFARLLVDSPIKALPEPV